jgi:hypothetical protein
MTQTTNRDAADIQALALALRAYLRPQIRRDERDIALEAVLLEQGVMAPTEAIGHIDIGDEWVTINLESGEAFNVNVDGTTEAF